MSGTLEDYKNWLKGWQAVVKEAEIQLEQASLVMPMIEKKIAELEALEPPKVQEVKDGK